ncbi:phosphotransferase enzyme family protein [Rhizobium sp. L1K21]|uniref:phosphotransferase enzyme family protein n=1 Tax=Rhizobium sp. L1K21 TaxID=2954933 RepID=UPI0020936B65|nr:phosphotransferase [Rhizobium sp. L1K21]MCO6185162.1 phosphotransferase [Rhizobium sp. L1K21]
MTNIAFDVQDEQAPADELINQALVLWALPSGSRAHLINISENATYLVRSPNGKRNVLRVHRENYHTHRAIECELAWAKALREEGSVQTPNYLVGRNGDPIQILEMGAGFAPRYMVMFEFVEGKEPNPDEDLIGLFEHLGEMAAHTHNHSLEWERPNDFERMQWTTETVFGPDATWGDWRNGPNVGTQDGEVLEELELVIKHRLDAFGRSKGRFGLIHADMRLANLLIDGDTTYVIDFDDCGLGWYLYDFAAGISFMEEHPQVPALKEAWVKGYRKVRNLPNADYDELDTFVMLRRVALLAWMGTHPEVEVVKELSGDFCKNTVRLAKEYLESMRG